MSTSVPEDVTLVTGLVLQGLTAQYPMLGSIEDGRHLLEDAVHYFQLLCTDQALTATADEARRLLLFELAALTDDAAAPVFLIGGFLSLCEERSNRITPALVRARAIEDMAATSRRLVTEAIARAEDASLRDGPTGLPNRDGLYRSLLDMLAEASRHQAAGTPAGTLAVLCIDLRHALDGNGQAGHPLHEAVMRSVGALLSGSVRARDVVGRSGPAQFQVLLPALKHPAQARNAASQLHFKAHTEITVAGHPLKAMPTVGFAIHPGDGDSPEQLLQRAGQAATEAYRIREPYLAFTADLDRTVDNSRAELVRQLSDAVHSNLAVLHFQPQLDLRTGKVTSAEALLRLPGLAIAPDRMLDEIHEFVREDEKRDVSFAEYLIRHAMTELDHFQREGLDMAVAVNLPANLIKPELPAVIEGLLHTWSLPAARLKIEITEKFRIENMEATRIILQQLKDIGIRLAIDDFGTGNSTFLWLPPRLPMDEIKVDQAFVRHLMSSPEDQVKVRKQVEMAHELGMTVVVEGVEDLATQQFITDLGCEKLQGYVFSKPLPAQAFIDFVKAYQ